MKIGILGGTFDPVHNGHLRVAEEVKDRLKLRKVVFVPSGKPWMKSDRKITSGEQRVEMVRLAIEGRLDFQMSLSEINRPGSTYTIETIQEFRSEFGDDAEIYFIIGWDGISRLHQWKNVEQLVKLCRIAVVPRPGFPPPDIVTLDNSIPGLSESLVLLDRPLIDVSATEIRKKVFQGLPFEQNVPAPVAEYIKKHRLYMEPEARR